MDSIRKGQQRDNCPEIVRYAACVSYAGDGYHGWQRLKTGLPTLQQHVEEALGKVANHDISVVCAGRTDAGVHACGQIVHFDTVSKRKERDWVFGSNRYLPDNIALHWVKPVSPDFHARFSALSRKYIYILSNHIIRPVHNIKKITWIPGKLSVNRMNEACQYLLGEHDFNAFRASQCQAKHALREVTALEVKKVNDVVVIDIEANAFLHHMVRNITGVLIRIGAGEKSPEWAREVLLSKDRRCAGVTAPSYGLYFFRAIYPGKFSLPLESIKPPLLTPFFSGY